MKITNRILSAAAAVCMASTVIVYPGINIHGKYSDNVSLTANADEYKTKDLELEYKVLDDGNVEITGYISSTSTDIEIPSTIDGKKVTSIGYMAFVNSGLTSITIPDGVTSIGDAAFVLCDSLTSITIPDSVTSIGGSAFYCCTSLTSMTIPDSVTNIGGEAFELCNSLTSITIPDSVTSISNAAFRGCESLISITIPDSVTSISDAAFSRCLSLTSITIPDSVTSIGECAFSECSGLTSITIPDSVTSIGSEAFFCTSLKSITIKNPDCIIGSYSEGGTIWYNATIYGYKNSTAQKYAEKYDSTFVELGVKGDINNDGSFGIADIVTIQKWLLNGDEELIYWKNCDLYEDDRIDAFDLVLMRQEILKNSK